MRRSSLLLLVIVLAASVSAFGQLLPDPNIMVGAFGATCPTGCSGDPNVIGTTGFTLFSNGAPTADIPWYILLAIPGTGKDDAAGGTDPTPPTITGTGFTIGAGADAGDLLQTTPSGTSIYDIADAAGLAGGLKGDGSMNAPNLFCNGATIPCASSSEITAFGSLPDFFDVFVYTVSAGALTGSVNFDFTATLPAGTYVAGLGTGSNGNQPFQTPFTTTGLASSGGPGSGPASASGPGPGPGSGPASASGPGPGGVPEPSAIVLLGSALLAVGAGLRKRLVRA